jgi:hypothetical protein
MIELPEESATCCGVNLAASRGLLRSFEAVSMLQDEPTSSTAIGFVPPHPHAAGRSL